MLPNTVTHPERHSFIPRPLLPIVVRVLSLALPNAALCLPARPVRFLAAATAAAAASIVCILDIGIETALNAFLVFHLIGRASSIQHLSVPFRDDTGLLLSPAFRVHFNLQRSFCYGCLMIVFDSVRWNSRSLFASQCSIFRSAIRVFAAFSGIRVVSACSAVVKAGYVSTTGAMAGAVHVFFFLRVTIIMIPFPLTVLS